MKDMQFNQTRLDLNEYGLKISLDFNSLIFFIYFITTIILFMWIAYNGMELRKATLAIGLYLIAYTLMGNPSTIYISILWILFGLLGSLNIPEFRRNYITKRILDIYKSLLPKISKTEQEAIEAGNVWWDAELFTGNPNWDVLRSNPKAELPPITTFK